MGRLPRRTPTYFSLFIILSFLVLSSFFAQEAVFSFNNIDKNQIPEGIEVSTNNLKISMAKNGTILGLSVGSREVGLTERTSLFSFADQASKIQITQTNLLQNPGFEERQATNNNVAFYWEGFGNGYVLDNETCLEGTTSIKIVNINNSMIGGAVQRVSSIPQETRYLIVEGYSKAVNVSSSSQYTYSLYLDIKYSDDTWLWGQSIGFSSGTHDWEKRSLVVKVDKPIKTIYYYALFRYSSGIVWFDNLSLTILPTMSFDNNSSFSQRGNYLLVNQTINSDKQYDARLKIFAENDFMGFQSSIYTTLNHTQCSALRLRYFLPINLTGWKWFNDLDNWTTIRQEKDSLSKTFSLSIQRGELGRISYYPFIVLVDPTNTFSLMLAVPLEPMIYELSANDRGVLLEVRAGLSGNQPVQSRNITVSFYLLVGTHPGWGFREALAKYYALFPSYFEKRVEQEGIWVPFISPSSVPNASDFGFMFHEGDNSVLEDDELGIYSFKYLEPWTYWLSFGDLEQKPNETQVLERIRLFLNSSDAYLRNYSRAIYVSGALNTEQEFNYYVLQAPWISGSHWSALFAFNTDPSLKGNESYWSQATFQKYLAEQAFREANATGARLDGIYLDSVGGLFFGDTMDYSENHMEAFNYWLGFSDTQRSTLGIPLFVTKYLFSANMAQWIHQEKRFLMGNGFNYNTPFLFPLFDVLGIEVPWDNNYSYSPLSRDSITYYHYWRAMSRTKPFLTLLNTDFSKLAPSEVETYFARSLAFGVYPSMFSKDAFNDNYFANSSYFERDRALFKKYIPIIKKVALREWNPLTLFYSLTPAPVSLEAFYNASVAAGYLTIHNWSNNSLTVKLAVDRDLLEHVFPFLRNEKIVVNVIPNFGSNDTYFVLNDYEEITVQPNQTIVYRFIINRNVTKGPDNYTKPLEQLFYSLVNFIKYALFSLTIALLLFLGVLATLYFVRRKK